MFHVMSLHVSVITLPPLGLIVTTVTLQDGVSEYASGDYPVLWLDIHKDIHKDILYPRVWIEYASGD